jgi:S-adenosylmethionine:tRNA-ribosyltransferase-isomerase (queuine synthetase)
MLLSDFDYELPQELIAQYPPARRRDSRAKAICWYSMTRASSGRD